jgi:hypothetical protein
VLRRSPTPNVTTMPIVTSTTNMALFGFIGCVNKTPAGGKLARIKGLFDRIVGLHVVVPIRQHIVPAVDYALLVSRELLFIGMIAPYPINVTSKAVVSNQYRSNVRNEYDKARVNRGARNSFNAKAAPHTMPHTLTWKTNNRKRCDFGSPLVDQSCRSSWC